MNNGGKMWKMWWIMERLEPEPQWYNERPEGEMLEASQTLSSTVFNAQSLEYFKRELHEPPEKKGWQTPKLRRRIRSVLCKVTESAGRWRVEATNEPPVLRVVWVQWKAVMHCCHHGGGAGLCQPIRRLGDTSRLSYEKRCEIKSCYSVLYHGGRVGLCQGKLGSSFVRVSWVILGQAVSLYI